eukprot:TRINITY_DN3817_c1_g1_i1.p1 TRINITY_DN3817_c1_g1~~TRINITY_DN3817_c1_g1_i1.p1  ORF type:complete len:116 (+),score=10.98 TRINITY_DN3817_c1_g1_i1:83-430(+)
MLRHSSSSSSSSGKGKNPLSRNVIAKWQSMCMANWEVVGHKPKARHDQTMCVYVDCRREGEKEREREREKDADVFSFSVSVSARRHSKEHRGNCKFQLLNEREREMDTDKIGIAG